MTRRDKLQLSRKEKQKRLRHRNCKKKRLRKKERTSQVELKHLVSLRQHVKKYLRKKQKR